CFRFRSFLLANRSLTQRTDDDPSVFRQINLPLILCEASDTFALQQIHTDRPPHSASSAHTYRLLVFKDRSAQSAAPEPPPGTASFASLRLQQRSEIMESGPRRVNTLLTNYFKKLKSLKIEQCRVQHELVRRPIGFP
ncbi:hypothetical protein, partial [Paraburkholderia youngii]|uniref:hypothetical protein n=1 Tax=Paraburkholderia youngii TaxID=2782701 RepID=UPI001C3C9C6A